MSHLSNYPTFLEIEKLFDTIATLYPTTSVISVLVAERLLENLDCMAHTPLRILEIGCGQGGFGRLVAKRYPKAQLIGVDLSSHMLKHAIKNRPWFSKQTYLKSNALQLPFSNNIFDCVLAHNFLPWCSKPLLLFQEIHRVLKTNGLLLFSSLGPDTLKEIRSAWYEITENRPTPLNWVDMHDLGDMLLATRFQGPVLETERLTFTYSTLHTLLSDLEKTGELSVLNDLQNTLSPSQIEALQMRYKRGPNNLLPLTYEVIYGHAFANALEHRIPLSELHNSDIPIELHI